MTKLVVFSHYNGEVREIQAIDTYGAVKIAVDFIMGKWFLAIANKFNYYDPELDIMRYSAVYTWSMQQNQFVRMRDLETDRATGVTFVTVDDFTNFVAISEYGDSTTSEVTIYKFNQEVYNFDAYQTLHIEWEVTSVRSFALDDSVYLTITIPKEGIRFYRHQFVEVR